MYFEYQAVCFFCAKKGEQIEQNLYRSHKHDVGSHASLTHHSHTSRINIKPAHIILNTVRIDLCWLIQRRTPHIEQLENTINLLRTKFWKMSSGIYSGQSDSLVLPTHMAFYGKLSKNRYDFGQKVTISNKGAELAHNWGHIWTQHA